MHLHFFDIFKRLFFTIFFTFVYKKFKKELLTFKQL